MFGDMQAGNLLKILRIACLFHKDFVVTCCWWNWHMWSSRGGVPRLLLVGTFVCHSACIPYCICLVFQFQHRSARVCDELFKTQAAMSPVFEKKHDLALTELPILSLWLVWELMQVCLGRKEVCQR